MLLILLIFILLVCIRTLGLPFYMAEVGDILHKSCLEYSSHGLSSDIYNRALVCGENLRGVSELYPILRSTGMIHLFVVSGAHLIFLQGYLDKLPFARWRWLQFCVLCLYAATCQFQAPISRALVHLALNEINQWQKLFWPRALCALMSTLTCLIIMPEWIHSLSFLMSAMAALILCLPLPKHLLLSSLVFYLWFFPMLLGLGLSHPIGIVVSPLAGLLISHLLFPLALICMAVPALSPLLDWLWQLFAAFCQHFLSSFASAEKLYLPLFVLWAFYLLAFFWVKHLESRQ